MKNKIVVFLLALVCFSACKHKPEDVISTTQKLCAEIDKKLPDYTQKHVDDLTSLGQGAITGYYRESEIKKIYAEHFGEKSRTFTEYYFDDGMLIYTRVQDFIYNKPNTYTEDKAKQNNDSVWYDDRKTRLETNTFYFGGKNILIKWVGPENDVPASDPEFINKQEEIWAQAAILLKELKEQDQ